MMPDTARHAAEDAAVLHLALRHLTRDGKPPPTLQARLTLALLHEWGAPSGEAPEMTALAHRMGVARPVLARAFKALQRKGLLTETTETVQRVVVKYRTVRRLALAVPKVAA
jgi:DNA-binding MarR family transcriptional regulator